MSFKRFEIDTEAMKKEVMEELVKWQIIMGIEEDEIDLFQFSDAANQHWQQKSYRFAPVPMISLLKLRFCPSGGMPRRLYNARLLQGFCQADVPSLLQQDRNAEHKNLKFC